MVKVALVLFTLLLAAPSVGQTRPAPAGCLNAGDTPTYAIFGQASGAIAFNPGVHRAHVRFKTQAGGTVGSTSVAVRTQ